VGKVAEKRDCSPAMAAMEGEYGEVKRKHRSPDRRR